MIANESNLHKRSNDKKNNMNYGSQYGLNTNQSPYCIVSYRRPRNDKYKTIQTRNLTANLFTKNKRKTNM